MKRHFNVARFLNWRVLRPISILVAQCVCAGSILASVCAIHPANAAPNSRIILGDYDAEPRLGNHVDTDRLVRRLNDLGANTYMWLIWHSSNDWNDLAVFLPKAEKAGIGVWVYLAPPDETAAQDKRLPYSEPFRLDYIQWAKEIAKLSLKYPNVKGYVIDDFWGNMSNGHFSPDYIRHMVAAGKAINPAIKFYPLMYFTHQMDDPKFTDTWAPLFDGVVAAYPPDQAAVEHALVFLEDRSRPAHTVTFRYPPSTPSKTGDYGRVTQVAQVIDAAHAQISFRYLTDVAGSKTSGYHRLQLRVDDKVVWDEDVTRYDIGPVTVDLSKAVRNKKAVTLSLGVFDIRGASNYAVTATFWSLNIRGLDIKDTDISNKSAWSQDLKGAFSAQRVQEHAAPSRFHLPMIVMPSGDERALAKFNHIAGTPKNIGDGVQLMTDLAQAGKIEGVVTYCLDTSNGSASFDAVQKIFKSIKR